MKLTFIGGICMASYYCSRKLKGSSSASQTHRPNVGPMLGRRGRRWTNIGPTLGLCVVFAGNCLLDILFIVIIILFYFRKYTVHSIYSFLACVYLSYVLHFATIDVFGMEIHVATSP